MKGQNEVLTGIRKIKLADEISYQRRALTLLRRNPL
jgi:hypothetical protein